MAAYTNPFHLVNGLQLDFTVEAATTATDGILGVSSSGQVTKFTSIPIARVSGGGNVTEDTSSVLTIVGGSGAVLSSGLTIQVKLAGAAQSGYLSTTDWNTFNNKLGTSLTDGQIWIGASGTNIATGRTVSGDFTISNTGVGAIASGAIVNADVNASAAIAFTKMAAFGANLMLSSDGSGFVTTVTGFNTTIAGYLTNITSDVQAQFTTMGQTIVTLTTNSIVQAPTAAETGYAIIWDDTASEWTLGPVGAGGSVTGPGTSVNHALVTWNGTGGTSLLSNATAVTLDASGNMGSLLSVTSKTFKLLDSDDSHSLILSATSDLTGDHVLALVTGDADRTITLSGDPTLADWFDQSVKTTGTPLFTSVTTSNAGGLHLLDSDESHDLIIVTSSNLTADRTLTLVTGDSDRTLTINASGTLYITGGTDVALADGGTGQSLADPAADTLWGWDNTDNSIGFWTIGTGLSYDHATHTLSSTGGASVALSSITAAVATHTIDNTTNPLVWSWTGAAAGSLFSMSSASTGITGSGSQNILSIASSGANSNSSVTSRGLNIAVTHTGTSSVNIAAELSASGASTNYALYLSAGDLLHSALAGGGARIVSVSNTGLFGAVSTAALTKVDDTNVTLTLGGTPTTALLQATSLTIGWTGTLAYARLVNGAGMSVVGRAANSSGVQSDITAGSDHNILRRSGATIAFGAIDLSQAGTVGSSILPVANGGTGSASGAGLISSLNANRIPYATSSTALADGPYWNNSTGSLGIGAAPSFDIDVQKSSASVVAARLYNSSTGDVGFITTRSGGTTASWSLYIPTGLSSFVLNGGSNSFFFTTDSRFGVGAAPTYDLDIQKTGEVVSRIVTSGTSHVHFFMQRSGGTASDWRAYLPSGSTDYRLYSGADRFIFTTAGLFTASSLQATGLTSGRIPIVGTSGLIGDNSALTFDGTYLFAGGLKSGTGANGIEILSSGYVQPYGSAVNMNVKGFQGIVSSTSGSNLNLIGGTAYQSSGSGNGGDVYIDGGANGPSGGTNGEILIGAINSSTIGIADNIRISANSVVYINSSPAGGATLIGNLQTTGVIDISGTSITLDSSGDLDIFVNGTLTIDTTVNAVDFVATSDKRVKTNITTFTNAMDTVLSIAGLVRRYDRTDIDVIGEVGFVAQELYSVAPQYVSTGDRWGVNYAKMVVPLYKAIEELNEEIKRLKAA